MTEGSASAAIAFRDVNFSRGSLTVLRTFSLDIRQGDALALVGRSGAGKSTILKLINRLLLPDTGIVLVEGRSTRDWNPFELRRRTGYVMQEVGLFPHLSIRENIAIVPRLLKWDVATVHARVDELIDLVGLADAGLEDRFPGQLSGGQRQRVGVARALAVDPPLLLMDEPFGALDPVTRAEMHREFHRIQARVKKTIVLVTHDMAEAFALGTQVGVLADGNLAAAGTPTQIARSDDPRVRALLEPLVEASSLLDHKS